MKPPPPCPHCRSATQVVPVVYGLATREAGERAERGEVVLGGCILNPDFPAWYCRSCRAGFGRLADRYPEWFSGT